MLQLDINCSASQQILDNLKYGRVFNNYTTA